MRTPRTSPRTLTKAQEIAEAALKRDPGMTPEVSPRPAAEYDFNNNEDLETPGRSVQAPRIPKSPRQEPPAALRTRAEIQAAASSSQAQIPKLPLPNNDDFDTPVEATPMKTAGAYPQNAPAERVRAHPPSDAPTSGPTSMHSREYEGMQVDSVEFDQWLKGLSMGQRMRVQERMAIRHAITRAEDAIRALSEAEEDHSYETWDAAAQWQLGHLREDENERFLNIFGYKLVDARNWDESPDVTGVQLDFSVHQHINRAGHNWYNVKCKMSGLKNGVDCVEWIAPRRLGQLRLDLHHRVKDSLGITVYEEWFQHARFAKFGGPPGTTARLNAWLDVLANIINKGVAQPPVAVLVLAFFSAPLPEGVAPPTIEKGFLRTAGLENHSNLGNQSVEVGF